MYMHLPRADHATSLPLMKPFQIDNYVDPRRQATLRTTHAFGQ